MKTKTTTARGSNARGKSPKSSGSRQHAGRGGDERSMDMGGRYGGGRGSVMSGRRESQWSNDRQASYDYGSSPARGGDYRRPSSSLGRDEYSARDRYDRGGDYRSPREDQARRYDTRSAENYRDWDPAMRFGSSDQDRRHDRDLSSFRSEGEYYSEEDRGNRGARRSSEERAYGADRSRREENPARDDRFQREERSERGSRSYQMDDDEGRFGSFGREGRADDDDIDLDEGYSARGIERDGDEDDDFELDRRSTGRRERDDHSRRY